MPGKTYKVRLPNGGVVQTTRSPRQIRHSYPGAVILARVEIDEHGLPHDVVFEGENPEPPAEEPAADAVVPAEASAEEPKADEKPAARSHHKKS